MNNIDFLKKHGVKNVKHYGERTLFDHLVGTFDLLVEWGNEMTICNAGLFHSIYGTEFFKKASINKSMRSIVQDQIGNKAEELAYLFCVIDRKELFTSVEPYELTIPSEHHIVQISKEKYSALLEIEVANIVEQAQHVTGVSKNIVDYWLTSFGKKHEFLSEAAKNSYQSTLVNYNT